MEIYANHLTALRAIMELNNPDLEIVAEKEYQQFISDLIDTLQCAVKTDRAHTDYDSSDGSYVLHMSGPNGARVNLNYDMNDDSVFVTFTFWGELIGMATIRDEVFDILRYGW